MLLSVFVAAALAGGGLGAMPPRPPGMICGPSEPGAAAVPQKVFLGVWGIQGSTAMFRVCADRGVAIVTGVDSNDGEVFRIQDAVFEGNRLRFTSIMPSTDFRLNQEWRAQGTRVLDFTHVKTGEVLVRFPEWFQPR